MTNDARSEAPLGPVSATVDAHPPQRIAELVAAVGIRKTRMALPLARCSTPW
jgi:hypothetical protein